VATPKRGALAAAMEREAEDIQRRRESMGHARRFFLKTGEECEVMILDNCLEDGFFRMEHNLMGSDGKFGNIEPCIADSGPCPACKSGDRPSLVAYLTAVVFRSFTRKNGEEVPYSKMLLPIKRGQYPDWVRLEQIAVEKHGRLRGVCVWLARKDEPTSFSTGLPVPNRQGELINEYYDEATLVAEFGSPEKKSRENGQVMRRENEDITAIDYRKEMPEPDADAIREEAGITLPGSTRRAPAEQEVAQQETRRTVASARTRLRGSTDDGPAPAEGENNPF
jgi:hypothetical protein